jgi:hypothetical protein
VTHREIIETLPRPETILASDCPGELALSARLYPPGEAELWHCTQCRWSFVVTIDAADGSKSLRNAFGPPEIPTLKIAEETLA